MRESLGFTAMNECIQHALELLEDNQKWFEHETGGFDGVDYGLFLTVEVLEHGLGDGVVDVHGWGGELSGLHELIQPAEDKEI